MLELTFGPEEDPSTAANLQQNKKRITVQQRPNQSPDPSLNETLQQDFREPRIHETPQTKDWTKIPSKRYAKQFTSSGIFAVQYFKN